MVWSLLVHKDPNKPMAPLLWFLRFIILLSTFIIFIEIIIGKMNFWIGIVTLLASFIIIYGITIEHKWSYYTALIIFTIGLISSLSYKNNKDAILYILFLGILIKERNHFK